MNSLKAQRRFISKFRGTKLSPIRLYKTQSKRLRHFRELEEPVRVNEKKKAKWPSLRLLKAQKSVTKSRESHVRLSRNQARVSGA